VYPVLPKIVILFAKCPAAGHVKTRLSPPLTPVQAAALQDALVRDALERFSRLHQHDFELHTDTHCLDAWAEYQVSRKSQVRGDLGLRMLHALEAALRSGYRRATILGSDAPTLPARYVAALTDAAADVALGPALDGGYYAISASGVHPGMFDHVRWSSRFALDDTEASVRSAGLRVERGETWFDLDEPADLARLIKEPDTLPRHTRKWLQELLSETAPEQLLHEFEDLLDSPQFRRNLRPVRRAWREP
jgi:rSAM/selenodomain-associated transferase 1